MRNTACSQRPGPSQTRCLISFTVANVKLPCNDFKKSNVYRLTASLLLCILMSD